MLTTFQQVKFYTSRLPRERRLAIVLGQSPCSRNRLSKPPNQNSQSCCRLGQSSKKEEHEQEPEGASEEAYKTRKGQNNKPCGTAEVRGR